MTSPLKALSIVNKPSKSDNLTQFLLHFETGLVMQLSHAINSRFSCLHHQSAGIRGKHHCPRQKFFGRHTKYERSKIIEQHPSRRRERIYMLIPLCQHKCMQFIVDKGECQIFSSVILYLFLIQNLSLNLELTHSARLVGQQVPVSVSPSQAHSTKLHFFPWDLNSGPHTEQQALYCLNHLSSSICKNFPSYLNLRLLTIKIQAMHGSTCLSIPSVLEKEVEESRPAWENNRSDGGGGGDEDVDNNK